MLLHCHSKRCNTTRDHKLKVATNDVVCIQCEESNGSVSEFMKNAMKSSGDVFREVHVKKAFMYKCAKCAVDRGVMIIDEQAVCDVCQHPLNLSTPMIEAIKSTAGVKNVDSGVSNETLEKGVIKRVNKESKKEDK